MFKQTLNFLSLLESILLSYWSCKQHWTVSHELRVFCFHSFFKIEVVAINMRLFVKLLIFSEENKITSMSPMEENFFEVLLSILLNFKESRRINFKHSITPIMVIFLFPERDNNIRFKFFWLIMNVTLVFRHNVCKLYLMSWFLR